MTRGFLRKSSSEASATCALDHHASSLAGEGEVFEAGAFAEVGEVDGAGRAVALLGDDDFRLAFGFGVGLAVFVAVVVRLPVDEGDDVGVLLDGAGFAEVGEHGFFVAAALLGGAGELAQGDDRQVEFFGEGFEAAGDGGDFLGAVFVAALPCPGSARRAPRHELEVVDDDEVEAAVHLAEAAGFGAHFGERDGGGVVDEDVGFGEAFEGFGEAGLVFPARIAFLDFLLVDEGFGGQHAAEKGLFRHFEREDGDDGGTADGCILRDIDRPGGFAHGRARGDDDELRLLEAAGHAVEVGEVGFKAGDFAVAFGEEVVDRAEGVADDLGDRSEAALDAVLGDFEQLGLGGVEHVEGVIRLVGGLSDGLGANHDELPEQRLVLDDADVLVDREASWQVLGEGGEVGDAADGFDLLVLGEDVAEGDVVDGAAEVGELGHAAEDAAVRLEGEVGLGDALGGLVVEVVVEQDGAENGALGVDGGGKAALELEVCCCGHGLPLGYPGERHWGTLAGGRCGKRGSPARPAATPWRVDFGTCGASSVAGKAGCIVRERRFRILAREKPHRGSGMWVPVPSYWF